MTKQQQTDLLRSYTNDRHELLKSKGEDYAGADVLGLFKDVANAEGRTPANVIASECHKKILRLQNLLQGKEPNNESILDNVKDLSNYADLLYCALNDKGARTQRDVLADLVSAINLATNDGTIHTAVGDIKITVCMVFTYYSTETVSFAKNNKSGEIYELKGPTEDIEALITALESWVETLKKF